MIDLDPLRAALGPIDLPEQELRELAYAIADKTQPAVRLRPDVDSTQLPFAVEPVPWHSRGFLVTDGSRPGGFIDYGAGKYYIQDAASLLAVRLLEVQPGQLVCDLCAAPGGKATAILDGQLVCDLCAAPGGKATAILEDLGDAGWLLANESIRSRTAALKFNLARHGSTRFVGVSTDPGHLADQLGALFDVVLVDAPCTGQTLVARGRAMPGALDRHQAEHSAARQTRILDAAVRLVRPGGRLVYSTCTFSYLENEAQVTGVIRRHPDWRIVACPTLTQWQSPISSGMYRVWPHRHAGAGGFAAALVNEGNTDSYSEAARSPGLRVGDLRAHSAEWGSVSGVSQWSSGHVCYGWPEDIPAELLGLAAFGPEIAVRKGSSWFPAYALAMRRDGNWRPRQMIALDTARAAKYLAGELVSADLSGWAVATWDGQPLGWLKGDGRRGKNHLPKPGRLSITPPRSRA
jgi:16S rRNA C967 or C1407 C5-methylase (RsmB/RsmF family)